MAGGRNRSWSASSTVAWGSARVPAIQPVPYQSRPGRAPEHAEPPRPAPPPALAVCSSVGIGVVSVFTATLASFFLATEEESETTRLERRLTAIEAKLDAVLDKIQKEET